MLAAATHSVPSPRIPMQPIALAPLQQAPPQLAPLQQAPRPMAAPRQQPAPLQQLNPIAQQVDFHIAFVADFLTTGAVLFGREFAIPGALLQDIHNGVPVPAAVGRALQTFVQIELEAGRELVGFAVEYVSFQLKFVANLVTLPIAAVGTLLSDLTPAPATRAAVASVGLDDVSATKRSTQQLPTTATTPNEATTGQSGAATIQRVRHPRTSTSSLADTVTDQSKEVRSTVLESQSVTSRTAKAHGEDSDAGPSNRADVDPAAITTHGRSDVTHKDVTHKRAAEAGSSTSSTTGGGERADAGSKHEPHHDHHGNPKGGRGEGD